MSNKLTRNPKNKVVIGCMTVQKMENPTWPGSRIRGLEPIPMIENRL